MIKPNQTNKLTKKFLVTLKNGTIIKSNCHPPWKSAWQIRDNNHEEIWEEIKGVNLNNRLCHTFSSVDHLDAWEDSIVNLSFKTKLDDPENDAQRGTHIGAAHHYPKETSSNSNGHVEPFTPGVVKVGKSSFIPALKSFLEAREQKEIQNFDEISLQGFRDLSDLITDFWVDVKKLGLLEHHVSPYVSNLHLVLFLTNLYVGVCGEDEKLENELFLAVQAFCKRIRTIIKLSGDEGGLV